MSIAKHTFFCAELDFGALNEDESHHASKVMRLNSGDQINIVNGQGRKVLAQITALGKKEIRFEIIKEHLHDTRPLSLHIAIGPTKSIDRFTFFLEKVAEMGVREITPIISRNSERKILKTEKLRKGMISALKQSGNFFLPILNEAVNFEDFVKTKHSATHKSIAHCDADSDKKSLEQNVKNNTNHLILIGPEGDFTPEEVILAKENDFSSVSLGKARLRTETAGILACHTVYLYS